MGKINVGPSSHSLLSASGSSRWMACPASVALSRGQPDNGNDSARWGTAAHELAAECLQTEKNPGSWHGRIIHVEGHDYPVDDRMVEMVQTYIDIVRKKASVPGAVLLVEQHVDYSFLFASEYIEEHGKQGGTGDAVILTPDYIEVIDLKTGQKAVSPDSSQLKMYGLGVLEEHDPDGMVFDWPKVKLTIVQPPKSSQPIEAEVTREELMAFATDATICGNAALSLLRIPVEEIPLEYLVPGEEQCNYCKAKAKCPKLRAVVSDAVFEDLDALEPSTAIETLTPTPPTTPDDLADAYAKLELVEGWCTAVRERAYAHVVNGGELPGHKLIAGKRGSRKWADEQKAEETLRAIRLKQDEMYKKSLISPTQAEKVLKDKPKRWERVSVLIVQEEGKPTLVPNSAKGEPLVVAKADDAFDDLNQDASDLI